MQFYEHVSEDRAAMQGTGATFGRDSGAAAATAGKRPATDFPLRSGKSILAQPGRVAVRLLGRGQWSQAQARSSTTEPMKIVSASTIKNLATVSCEMRLPHLPVRSRASKGLMFQEARGRSLRPHP